LEWRIRKIYKLQQSLFEAYSNPLHASYMTNFPREIVPLMKRTRTRGKVVLCLL
jgi:hypothetical protein